MSALISTEDTIALLKDLIAVCTDGERGYQTAATHVKNSQLTGIFDEYAKQRAGFIRELQAQVKRLGGDPSASGSLGAALHRGWIDVKSALTGGGVGAIAAACETGEDAAKAAFERVVDTSISGEIRSLIEKQWHKIQEAHSRMLRLKEEIDAGAEYPTNE